MTISVASDAFAGALLAGIAKEEPLETAIDMGHWLAYLGIQQMGPKYVLLFLRLYRVLLTFSVIRSQNNFTPLPEQPTRGAMI
jgi:hypothetical protein